MPDLAPTPPVSENWWLWERTCPHDVLRAGAIPMLRPMWRVQNDDPVLTGNHAFGQCFNQLRSLLNLWREANLPGMPPISICDQDLGGYHKRPEEHRTLFDKNMTQDRVIENIQWWRTAYAQLMDIWKNCPPLPKIAGLNYDWEWAWLFGFQEDGKPVPERDWRVAMVTEPALKLGYQPVMTNWKCQNFLNTVNACFYEPDPARIEKSLATVRDSPLPKSAWITAATAGDRHGEFWTPDKQADLVKQLRDEGYTTFIYWYTQSTEEDWKALINSIGG